jgi:hypothetical protein
MISITSTDGSSDGVVFNERKSSKLNVFEPRVTKSKALDGTVIYDHRGMVTADRVLNIKADNLTKDQTGALQTIIENETYINLSTNAGFFVGVISRAEIDNGFVDLDFWVKE